MSLFSISDLHLSLGASKPMDVFGSRWRGYTEKLEKNWRAVVKDCDTVVVPGDISWAMTLDEALADLRFIDSLPGRKLLGKGNHDYWWETVTKMKNFLCGHGISSIDFLHNNAFTADEFIVCGTRGWFAEEKLQESGAPRAADYDKISARECGRLRASLCAAASLRCTEEGRGKPILVYLHFPPAFGDFVDGRMISLMKEYGAARCFYGHIHGRYDVPSTVVIDSLPLTIISADYLKFTPMLTSV